MVFPSNNGKPPVAAAYQSIVVPGAAKTLSAGVGDPSQILGLLGAEAALTGAQLQLGALTDACCVQPAELVTVSTALDAMGMPVTEKLGAFPLTVPTLAFRVLALELTKME